jgi:hypothetical protein
MEKNLKKLFMKEQKNNSESALKHLYKLQKIRERRLADTYKDIQLLTKDIPMEDPAIVEIATDPKVLNAFRDA